jgi:hypothetical protein
MATQDSRIRLKRGTTTGDVPTVPTSSDHTDGTWSNKDLYIGELYLNTIDDRLWVRTNNDVKELAVGSGQIIKGQTTIISADVLTSNATPVSLVAGIAGKELKCIEASIHIKHGGTDYATNLNVGIRNVGASTSQMENTGVLGAASDLISSFIAVEGGASANVITGAGLEFFTKGGDPTAGNSDIVIDYTYIVRDIP